MNGDNAERQRVAICVHAKAAGLTLVSEFYDAAVSDAAQVDQREQFAALLAHCAEHGISVVVVENASHFARDLAVQLTGHDMLQSLGIE